MKILHITTIVPAPISAKKQENNILFLIANKHEQLNQNTSHVFIYVQPYTNFLLSLLKRKWAEYYRLQKQGFFEYEGKKILVLTAPRFKNDYLIKPLINYIGFLMNKKKIEKIINNVNPDLIHSHNLTFSAYLSYKIKRKFKIPYIITLRGSPPILFKNHIRKILRCSKVIVSVSMHRAKMFKKFIPDSQISVIPHPIDDNFFEQGEIIYTKPKVIKFVTFSRLLDWKNIDLVIRSFSRVNGNFEYDIYGDGPEMGKLKYLINDLGLSEKIKLKGYVDRLDVPKILSEYHVFILLSYLETFGRVYIEAMARGLPVICTRDSGIDGFIENGVQGYLVENGNINEAVNALTHFINEPSIIKTMGKKAFETSKSFTWTNIIHKYCEVYKK